MCSHRLLDSLLNLVACDLKSTQATSCQGLEGVAGEPGDLVQTEYQLVQVGHRPIASGDRSILNLIGIEVQSREIGQSSQFWHECQIVCTQAEVR